MKPNPLPFLREKWAGVPEPAASFAGKTVIVTGASSGLGFEAAAKFAALGAERVVLGVRNESKGAVARREIEGRSSCRTVLDVWPLDMGSYVSVQAFAARADEELPRLDIAILNAGITAKDYVVGAEGWESTLQVNVLGTALLGLLLLPKLRRSKVPPAELAHLVVITSEAHGWLGHDDFPDPGPYGGNLLKAINGRPADGKAFDGLLQNARSKLFAMYAAQALAELAMGPSGEADVIVVSTCPGACKSDLARDVKSASFGNYIAVTIFDMLFNKPTEQGARTYAAVATLGKEAHGGWYKTTALAE